MRHIDTTAEAMALVRELDLGSTRHVVRISNVFEMRRRDPSRERSGQTVSVGWK
ncbi:hypothetical protein CZ774_13175 [Frigoribacterium sp. JB110]|nr:hypothetical protein CZ774_13175 [Frigoribacterium sp. JB110]